MVLELLAHGRDAQTDLLHRLTGVAVGVASVQPGPRSSREAGVLTSPFDSERANALIVIVLTFACTALAIFDLFLLASGL